MPKHNGPHKERNNPTRSSQESEEDLTRMRTEPTYKGMTPP